VTTVSQPALNETMGELNSTHSMVAETVAETYSKNNRIDFRNLSETAPEGWAEITRS
jgi:hypothetical protein